MTFPDYDDLPRPADDFLPLAVGIHGNSDELGTWNNLTAAKTVAAARLVRRGLRFNLNLPLHMPLGVIKAGAHAVRSGPVSTMFEVGEGRIMGRDDKIEIFNQASTHWDGLTHVGDRQHGFYNGVQPDNVGHGEESRNGIDKIAQFVIATRAVLIDLPSHFAAAGRMWHPMGSHAATVRDVEECLERTGTELQQGDVLLVRTGWLRLFLDANADEKFRLFQDRSYSGLAGDDAMCRFLWNRRVAAVASDNVTVEVFPITADQASLHLAIARLGLNLGEMFDLEALADYCLSTDQYECFFTSMPLNLRGGAGSPANAMALV